MSGRESVRNPVTPGSDRGPPSSLSDNWELPTDNGCLTAEDLSAAFGRNPNPISRKKRKKAKEKKEEAQHARKAVPFCVLTPGPPSAHPRHFALLANSMMYKEMRHYPVPGLGDGRRQGLATWGV